MPVITTQTLVRRAEAISDMQDNFVNPTEWMYWATQERLALEILLARSGWTQGFTSTTITVTGAEGGDFSVLPSTGVMAVVAVHESTSAGVRPLNFNNSVDFLRQVPGSSLNRGHATEFRVNPTADGFVMNFFPDPLPGETYIVTYIPQPATLTLDTPAAGESNSVSYPMGWEERIVLGMARRALIKEDSDTQEVEKLIREVERQIEEVVFARVLSDTPSIRNVDGHRRGWVARLLFPLWQQWAWL